MKTVVSKDGTRIAFDQIGSGPRIILVAGAFSYRKYKGLVELFGLPANKFAVINYDRRAGRERRAGKWRCTSLRVWSIVAAICRQKVSRRNSKG
jgi:hypothetical protein